MWLLNRAERGLDRLINRGFARVFQAELVPADIAAALRRECDDTTVTRDSGRVLAANDYVVQVALADHARLGPYFGALCTHLQEVVTAHASEQRYLLAGHPIVRLEIAEDVQVGVCRALGLAVPDGAGPGALTQAAAWVTVGSERVVLAAARTVIGRGPDADIRLRDPGVSGVHAAISVGPPAMIEDLGSTNGTVVDGHAVTRAPLRHGSRIVLGVTTLTFHDH